MQGDGYPVQPELTKQNRSFWMLLQQRRRKRRLATGHISASPSELIFGDVAINGGEQDILAKLANRTPQTFTVTAVNITAAQGGDWGRDLLFLDGTGGGLNMPVDVPPGHFVTITTQFLPTATGIETAFFDVVTTAGTFRFAAIGNGV